MITYQVLFSNYPFFVIRIIISGGGIGSCIFFLAQFHCTDVSKVINDISISMCSKSIIFFIENYPSRTLYLTAKGGIRLCLIILNHAYFLTYLFWVAMLYPMKIFGYDDLFQKIEGHLTLGLIKMITMWNEWAGYEVWEAGDDITPCLEERTLVVANHQTPADVIMLFSAFVGWDQIIPNVMFIMDHFIKYSTAGIVSSIRKDFFILQGKETRRKSLDDLSKHINDFYLVLNRKWLVLFPEGGFLCKRKKKSQNYAEKNNLPHLELVTIPRVGAFKVIMEELKVKVPDDVKSQETKHKLKYILDVTIGYPNGEPLSFTSIVFGNKPSCKIILLYRLYSVDEVLSDNRGSSNWLIARWVEKEKILEEFYKTGKYQLKINHSPPRRVKQNFSNYCALHAIFIFLTIFPYHVTHILYQYSFN